MFRITVVFGESPVPWGFYFKDRECAKEAFTMLDDATEHVCIEDQFGQTAIVDKKRIHGFMIEDMEQSKLAQIEVGLHQARMQAKAQQMAQSDPVMRAAAMSLGPAIINPMGNSRFS